MYSRKAVSIIFLVILFTPSDELHLNSERIKLEELDPITFALEKNTISHGFLGPVSQLECIGGSNECKWLPEVVNCFNRGFDKLGTTVLWDCNADLFDKSEDGEVQVVKFNQTLVICEGYNYTIDEDIFLRSCRLQYSIDTIDGRLHYNSFWRRVKDHPILFGILLTIPIASLGGFVVLVVFSYFSCKRKGDHSSQEIYETERCLKS